MTRFSLFHNLCSAAHPALLGYTPNMVKIALVTALLFAASGALADDSMDVRCQEIAFSRAVENKDIESFKKFLDNDARFVGHSVGRGPDEITSTWQVFFSDDGPAIKWRPQFVEVLEDGSLALTRGPFRIINKDADGNLVEHWGTFNSIWRKNSDGQWRVVFDAGSSAAEPPNEEIRALIEQEDSC